ncbi:hypothetical protein OG21DRAFT_1524056 [Imleria badia]|nr:hypothetical protein OG21DRAFT_1524056 [Imleria badia]
MEEKEDRKTYTSYYRARLRNKISWFSDSRGDLDAEATYKLGTFFGGFTLGTGMMATGRQPETLENSLVKLPNTETRPLGVVDLLPDRVTALHTMASTCEEILDEEYNVQSLWRSLARVQLLVRFKPQEKCNSIPQQPVLHHRGQFFNMTTLTCSLRPETFSTPKEQ